MSQEKNIDQADKKNQTIESIVLSRAVTTKVEKNQRFVNQNSGDRKRIKKTS